MTKFNPDSIRVNRQSPAIDVAGKPQALTAQLHKSTDLLVRNKFLKQDEAEAINKALSGSASTIAHGVKSTFERLAAQPQASSLVKVIAVNLGVTLQGVTGTTQSSTAGDVGGAIGVVIGAAIGGLLGDIPGAGLGGAIGAKLGTAAFEVINDSLNGGAGDGGGEGEGDGEGDTGDTGDTGSGDTGDSGSGGSGDTGSGGTGGA